MTSISIPPPSDRVVVFQRVLGSFNTSVLGPSPPPGGSISNSSITVP